MNRFERIGANLSHDQNSGDISTRSTSTEYPDKLQRNPIYKMTYSLSVLVGVEKNLSREARLSVDFFLERKLTNASHSAREDLSATKECSVFPYVISPVFAPRHGGINRFVQRCFWNEYGLWHGNEVK